jgi:Tol biopolymer transport system component
MRTCRVGLTGLLVSGVLAVLCQGANASYPGAVGRIAFGIAGPDGNGNIYSARPDGRGLRRLTDDSANDLCPAYSPNGRQIAFCSDRTGAWEIWAMDQNGSDQHQITNLGNYAVFPDYSPDGRRIAFSGDEGTDPNDEIYVVRDNGAELKQLTRAAGNNDYPAWSPSGRKIAFTSDRSGYEQVYVMNADGSGQRQLTFDANTHDQLPDWSPDGRRIAYEDGASPNGRIWVMNADGTGKRELTHGPGDDFGAAWSPDGRQIAFVRDFGDGNRPVYVMNADGSNQRPLHPGAKQYVPAWQPVVAPVVGGRQPCQSGRIVFSRLSQTGPDIYAMNACGQHVQRLTSRGGHFAKLSPNGRLIIFSAIEPGAQTSDLWIMHADGSDLRDLTNTPDRNDVDPSWSPDARNIVWSSGPNGSRAGQLFVMNLWTGVTRAITQPFQPPEPGDASWSPDGREIVFDEFPTPPALARLWMVDRNGHNLRAITPAYLDAFGPDWGPDGLIAFSSGASAPQGHLWTMRSNGADLHQITTDADGSTSELPAFSPDGQWLTYTHILASGVSSIWKLRVSGADATPLTAGPEDEYSDWGPAH